MGNWGKPGFGVRNPTTLMSTVSLLELSTRQKIYAFIQRGNVFRRQTWDGCVMNQIVGTKSITSTADKLSEPSWKISKFIHAWDRTATSLTDGEATKFLAKCLEQVGLTDVSPAYEADTKVTHYTVRVFTSEETRLVEQLRKEIEDGAFDEDLSQIQELSELCLV